MNKYQYTMKEAPATIGQSQEVINLLVGESPYIPPQVIDALVRLEEIIYEFPS